MTMLRTTIVDLVSPGDTSIRVAEVSPTLSAALAAPGHLFAEIYNAGRSEIVLVSAVVGTTLHVQRGMRGTTARVWRTGDCVGAVEYVMGPCPPPAAADPCLGAWAALTVSPELLYDPTLPTLGLKPTGVVAGSYGGAEVNAFGQLVSIPENWPAAALPVFDPCGCEPGGGSGDNQTAAEVPYAPAVGGAIAVGDNVQIAITQLEAALQAVQGALVAGGGVASVGAASPLQVGGTPSAPVIAHGPSGVAAGVYAGFTVNAEGHIVSYSAPPLAFPDITGSGAITALFGPSANPAGNYDISVAAAGYTAPGVITLVNPVDILNNTVPPGAGGYAVTWDGLTQFFNNQPAAAQERATIAAGSWSLAAGAQVASGGGSTVMTLVAPGVLEVTMLPAAPGEYHVSASIRNDAATEIWVEHLSAAIFRIHFTPAAVNPATNVDFHVTDLT